MDIEKIIRALARTDSARILVAGDFCLDKYLYVDAALDELSLETGKIAYQVVRNALYPGAGGTIAGNLCALGAQVVCAGLVGDDGEGYELMRCLRDIGADTSHMVTTDGRCTSTYMKPMRMEGGAAQEMNRLDMRGRTATPASLEDRLIQSIRAALPDCDAVIICDQFIERNRSAVTERVRDALAGFAAENPDKLFYADSRGFIDLFRNISVKCNASEVIRCVKGVDVPEPGIGEVKSCAAALYRRNKRPVFVTLGERGMLVQAEESFLAPAFAVSGPVDICGAGDSASAGIVLGLVLGLDYREAALLANAVASITIQQIGVTGTATPQQAAQRLRMYAGD